MSRFVLVLIRIIPDCELILMTILLFPAIVQGLLKNSARLTCKLRCGVWIEVLLGSGLDYERVYQPTLAIIL